MSFFNREFPTCGECNHARYYPVHWWYPALDPYCEITKMSVKHDDLACENFVGGGFRVMKVLIKFNQEYYKPIVDGVKTQTMRLSAKRIDVQPGEICIAVFPDGQELILRITEVGYKYFKSINDEDAKREGFGNADELKECLKDIYRDYYIDDHNRFYYYRFAVVDVKSR